MKLKPTVKNGEYEYQNYEIAIKELMKVIRAIRRKYNIRVKDDV